MADHVVHISEEEAAGDFSSVLARVRAGAEVVIESATNKVPVAIMHSPPPAGRTISECIALAKEREKETGESPVIDADFAKDVEAAVASHREPLEPPAWD